MSSDFHSSSQEQTPLLDTLKTLANQPDAAFYAPGHKRGQGISQKLANLLGEAVFKADLPELPELDNLFAPETTIKASQDLAAQAFGAEQTWFLVNGSTCGIEAAILATCGEGDKIILPRNIHQSAIAGLVLSGAMPVFINPPYNPQQDLTYCITPEAVKQALKQHPTAKAIMLVYPTYHGICGDLSAIAALAHQHSIPLLVDEAHGPHFYFHPDLPTSALAAGADLVVQSSHKVIGAMTQASMLHVQGSRIDRQRLSKSLQLLQSTSPSYLLLASLDAARQQMATQGKELLDKTLNLSSIATKTLNQLPKLEILKKPTKPTPGFLDLDLTRLTVGISQLGIDGFAADEILHCQLGVTAELPMLQHLTFIISLGNTETDIEKLMQGFATLSAKYGDRSPNLSLPTFPQFSLISNNQISPRQAFFAPSQTLPLEQTIDRISTELICPYPPGIPVLMPGEKISASSLNFLQKILAAGGSITGCSDTTLKTIRVLH